MSKFKINSITDKSGYCGPVIAGVSTNNSTGCMIIPAGSTEFRGGRGRAIAAGGRVSPSNQTTIDVVDIATIGNSQDFGDMSTRCGHSGADSSSTRGVVHVTFTPASTYTSTLEYITISSGGGSNDFGDRTVNTIMSKHTSGNNTRGVFGGGRTAPNASINVIDFVTIASTGDASSFGDLRKAFDSGAGNIQSPTRGIFAGGYFFGAYTVPTKDIDSITFATGGNSVRFGDLFTGRYRFNGCSGSTRGVFMGGRYTSSQPNTISSMDIMDYITLSTEGNAQDFGNLTQARGMNGCASSLTRGLCMGGGQPANSNVIDFITFSTTGDATDFGDLTQARQDITGGFSDVHGGLGR